MLRWPVGSICQRGEVSGTGVQSLVAEWVHFLVKNDSQQVRAGGLRCWAAGPIGLGWFVSLFLYRLLFLFLFRISVLIFKQIIQTPIQIKPPLNFVFIFILFNNTIQC